MAFFPFDQTKSSPKDARKTILCIHYNGNSSGSFVNATVATFKELGQKFNLVLMVGCEGPFTSKFREQGIKVIVHPLHEMADYWKSAPLHALKFRRILRAHNIDVVYVMDFVYWKPLELAICKWLGLPTVVFCHFYKSSIFSRSFLKDCKIIITNSLATSKRIAGGIFEHKTKVIYNSISFDDFTVCRRDKNEELTLGFIGSLIPIKGVEDLILAMPAIIEKSKINKLKIAGSDRDNTGYPEKLQELVDKLGLNKHIDFVGHVDSRIFLHDIDILAVPSHDEPFGYVNIEAGASAIPVVATNVGGIPEIVIDSITGILVTPRCSEELADACIRLGNDRELRSAMGENARERVRQFFSYEATMKQWPIIFSELQ